jgi:hypothetical protein
MSIRNRFRICALASAVALAATSFACSISYSLGSLSDSIASSSDSSSSSSPGASSRSYRKDVESYTEAFVVSGGGEGAFMSGIGDLAKKRGITDWESDENTWVGIGRGLGRTKIDTVHLDVYKTNWSGGDAAKAKLIQEGFDEVR